MRPHFRFRRLAGSLLLAASLTACQHNTVPLATKADIPPAFEQTTAAHGPADVAQWWRHWHDPVLSRLIEQGLQHNHDIRIARSRMAEAQALSRLAAADLKPSAGLSLSAGASRSQADNPLNDNSRALLGALPAAADLAGDRLHSGGHGLLAGIQASWAPDIFGHKRSDADAARHAALGERERLYGAQVLVSAQIADHYLQARALQQRQRLGQARAATLAQWQRYAAGRFRAGHITRADVAAADTEQAALAAELASLQAQTDAHIRSLAVLTGQTPQSFRLPESPRDALQHLPAAPAGQTPLAVLDRRPDVRARQQAVAARAAQLGSAQAERLPRFDIRFLWQHGRISLDGGPGGLNLGGGLISAGLTLPLFTAGRIEQNIAAADARLEAALVEYEQSLLRALAEVDSSYQLQFALARQNRALAEAEAHSRHRAEQSERLFELGNITLDQALRARVQAQQLADRHIQGRLAEAQNLLRLYQALGGGWTAETADSNPQP